MPGVVTTVDHGTPTTVIVYLHLNHRIVQQSAKAQHAAQPHDPAPATVATAFALEWPAARFGATTQSCGWCAPAIGGRLSPIFIPSAHQQRARHITTHPMTPAATSGIPMPAAKLPTPTIALIQSGALLETRTCQTQLGRSIGMKRSESTHLRALDFLELLH